MTDTPRLDSPHPGVRNPFGVPDVPEPDGADVLAFADGVALTGAADDVNAATWHQPRTTSSIAGAWSSRWCGDGIDWQHGIGRLHDDGERVFILFDWDDTRGHGLIEARWTGPDRLVGRYLNLGNPEITRPWVGLVVDPTRIDGEHSGGRIDFRR